MSDRPMEVTFTRTGERRYGVFVDRPGFPAVGMEPAPSYDEDLPHDFVHFVVEDELGLDRGVFGQLAAGGDAGTFRLASPPDDAREASRRRRRQRSRGDRLSAEGFAAAERSERAATICHHAWLERSDSSARRAKARKLAPFVEKVRAASSSEELASLSEATIDRVCRGLDELSARWAEVEIGQSIKLPWTPGR